MISSLGLCPLFSVCLPVSTHSFIIFCSFICLLAYVSTFRVIFCLKSLVSFGLVVTTSFHKLLFCVCVLEAFRHVMTFRFQIWYFFRSARFLSHRRYTSQLVTVQGASRSDETLALALWPNGKGRGSNRPCFGPQQVYGFVTATLRSEQ